jgi:START domain
VCFQIIVIAISLTIHSGFIIVIVGAMSIYCRPELVLNPAPIAETLKVSQQRTRSRQFHETGTLPDRTADDTIRHLSFSQTHSQSPRPSLSHHHNITGSHGHESDSVLGVEHKYALLKLQYSRLLEKHTAVQHELERMVETSIPISMVHSRVRDHFETDSQQTVEPDSDEDVVPAAPAVQLRSVEHVLHGLVSNCRLLSKQAESHVHELESMRTNPDYITDFFCVYQDCHPGYLVVFKDFVVFQFVGTGRNLNRFVPLLIPLHEVIRIEVHPAPFEFLEIDQQEYGCQLETTLALDFVLNRRKYQNSDATDAGTDDASGVSSAAPDNDESDNVAQELPAFSNRDATEVERATRQPVYSDNNPVHRFWGFENAHQVMLSLQQADGRIAQRKPAVSGSRMPDSLFAPLVDNPMPLDSSTVLEQLSHSRQQAAATHMGDGDGKHTSDSKIPARITSVDLNSSAVNGADALATTDGQHVEQQLAQSMSPSVQSGMSADHREMYKREMHEVEHELRVKLRDSCDWNVTKERQGVVIRTKVFKKIPAIHRMETIVDALPREVFRAFFDIDSRREWDEELSEASKVVDRVDHNTDVVYVRRDGKFRGLVSSRDYVDVRKWNVAKDGEILIVFRGLKYYPGIDSPKNTVRAVNHTCGIALSPTNNRFYKDIESSTTDVPSCRVVLLLQSQVNGLLPQSVADHQLQKTLLDWPRKLRNYMLSKGQRIQ